MDDTVVASYTRILHVQASLLDDTVVASDTRTLHVQAELLDDTVVASYTRILHVQAEPPLRSQRIHTAPIDDVLKKQGSEE